MKNQETNPKIIFALEPKNKNGFIIENGVKYLYNKVLKMYMRTDIVKEYRKLRKKHYPTRCLIQTVFN